MTGPFAETSIVLEMETGNPEQYLRVTPDRPNGDRWLHRVDEFDPTPSRGAVVDRYALPASDSYTVETVSIEETITSPLALTDDAVYCGTYVDTHAGHVYAISDR